MKLIDADALIEKFRLDADYSRCTAIWVDSLKEWIRNQPDIELAPVIHAHWVEIYGGYICSNCGTEFSTVLPFCTRDRSMPKFCLHCGAKMDEEVSK